jgi:beta-xylosidase
VLERPKVIYNAKSGKFVMWFHLELKGMGYRAARSGVAVAEHVTGPYTFLRSFRPNAGYWPQNVAEADRQIDPRAAMHDYSGGSLPDEPNKLNLFARDFAGGQMARDQTLFVDDDGAAYHLYASEENSTLQISKLSDDYLSYSGEYVRVFIGRFMEAPAICKHQGKYYFIGSGCTGWAPNAARSAVAESIWGPWSELGNPCVGDDAELTFHGQSTYILPVNGKPETYIFMADRWNPQDAIDGRYIWLPIHFRNNRIEIEWQDEWQL